jgi:hypothetical protein
MLMPGVSAGTMNCDIFWYVLASGFVTAMTMKNEANRALLEKNFSPLNTQSSPERSAPQMKTPGAAPACG